MQKYLLILLTLIITGCSSLQFPGVYKIEVEQGNVITQEMIDQLEVGMSREQVEYIMGRALIKDAFNTNRWDYVYTKRTGEEKGEKHHLTVFFEGNQLKSFKTDIKASTTVAEKSVDEPTQDSATAP
jgi:outer membrane protein assembly factor BamE